MYWEINSGIDRIRVIRRLDEKHNYSLLCDTQRLGDLVIMDNSQFQCDESLDSGALYLHFPELWFSNDA